MNYFKRIIAPLCILVAIAFGIFFFSHGTVHAQTEDFGLTQVQGEISLAEGPSDLRVIIVRIINIFLGFLGIVAIGIVMYGGYLYMTSAGDEEKVSQSKKLLINGAIGFVIIILSFALTSFVVSRLQGVLDGEGGGGGGGSGDGGSDPADFCSVYPNQCCTTENFVVKSITPSSLDEADMIRMNNTVVRVVFSKKVGGTAEQIFKIYQKQNGQNQDISNKFTFAFAEDNSVIEARYNDGDVCTTVNGIPMKCIPNGEYEVTVNDSVRDSLGKLLTTETSCGNFPRSAKFSTGGVLTDAPIIDNLFGGLDPVSINGHTGADTYSVAQGFVYPIKTTLRDDKGNGYARVRIYREGAPGTILKEYLDGPFIANGSSQAFPFTYGLFITDELSSGSTYIAEVTAHDIDGNISVGTVKFRTVPSTCRNGVLDPGEGPEADQGGLCGSSEGSSCTSQSDCSYWLKCLDASNNECSASGGCMCKPTPYISKVEYMNGASGNWITISGKNFGINPGRVKFNYDFNNNGTIESSVTASLAQCTAGSTWTNSWIIAEVPSQAEISNQSTLAQLEIIGGIQNDAELFGASSVSISGNYAYVTAQQSGYLHIIDISDRTLPKLMKKVPIPGAFGVYTDGNYAYVVNGNSLRIVDVSDKNNPTIVGQVVDSTLLAGSRSVFVSGNYAYVAAEGDDSMRIIDISNKVLPVIVGGFKDQPNGMLDAARTIYVVGNYVYITSYYNNSLRIFDVSNKTNPVMVGALKDDTRLFHISGLAVSGRYAYVTIYDTNIFSVIDISNPALPKIVGSVQDNTNLNGAFSVAVSGSQVFVANRRGNSVAVVNVADPEQPKIIGLVKNDVDLKESFNIAAVGKYGYVANFSDRSFRVVDASNIGTALVNNPSISVTNDSDLTDSTNDNFGPNLGTFTYNNIQRPSLCAVTVAQERTVTLEDGTIEKIPLGVAYGPEGTVVKLDGKGFGGTNGAVTFGKSGAPVSSWSTDLVNSAVPFGGAGEVSVYLAAKDGEKSNPVTFNIKTLADLYPPKIVSIDPTSPTKGSYITIKGTNFGSSGKVYFTLTEGDTCLGGGCIESEALPLFCGNPWSPTQIIAKVPDDLKFAKYFVVVSRNEGVNTFRSSGKDFVEVVEGPARPSICKIDPIRGSAPLSGSAKLILSGENFSSSAVVKYYYSLASNAGDPETWLTKTVSASSQKIETTIPYDSVSGFSMSSGPIKVKNSSGLYSNAINYEVLDCRLPNTSPVPGFQCCSEGPDAGKWKNGNSVCAGVTRDAGYVWRFTTGKAPQRFFVVESCSADIPSPSPSTLWASGKNVCLNADLVVQFNLPLNTASLVTNAAGDLTNVLVATCGGTDSAINCEQNFNLVTDEFKGEVINDVLKLKRINNNNKVDLPPNTWYRVALLSDVASSHKDNELGVTVDRTEKIQATKPCTIDKKDAAYCFDFKTGSSDFMCTLIGAGIHPREYTTALLGIVQDPRYALIYDQHRIFNIGDVHPLNYLVYGKANLECTTIGVDDKPWIWGPLFASPATAFRSSHSNAQGYAIANQSYPQGSEIYAKITEGEVGSSNFLVNNNLSVPYPVKTLADGKVIRDAENKYPLNEGGMLRLKVTLDDIPTSTPGFLQVGNGGSRRWRGDRVVFERTSLASVDPATGFQNEAGGMRITVTETVFLDGHRTRIVTVSYRTNDPSRVEDPFFESSSVTYTLLSGVTTFTLEIRPKTNVAGEKIFDTKIITSDTTLNFSASVFDHENGKKGYEYHLGHTPGVPENSGIMPLGGVFEIIEFVPSENTKEIIATSTLKINLGNPYAKSVWPSCIEACVNAQIGIEFNQLMAPQTYTNQVKLYMCSSEECLSDATHTLTPVEVTLAKDAQSPTILQAKPSSLLPNRWYLVELLGDSANTVTIEGVRSVEGYSGDSPKLGKAATTKQWKFRTKASSAACAVDTVNIIPDPFISTYIGQAQIYHAYPKGSPDQCSPYGQYLDPWGYGWNWSTGSATVAKVSNFSFSTSPKSTCGISCTPLGSDIPREQSAAFSICGNATIDPGEDCDIAASGEVAGKTCTTSCLRPGNMNPTTCGNGTVEPTLGEECDPKQTDQGVNTAYCTNTCLFTGSSREQTGNPTVPVCGSGTRTYGEDCDLGTSAPSNRACSSQCLNLGTQLSQAFCDNLTQSSDPQVLRSCQSAVSICGNGKLESGEECDITDSVHCSNRCLIQNACGTPFAQCNPQLQEGCLSDCTLAGSSITYSNPSVCGDGKLGIGEYGDSVPFGLTCERDFSDTHNVLGGNPVQVVTSVGKPAGNTVVPLSSLSTKITASAITSMNTTTGQISNLNSPITGEGDYTLQCGYTEYSEPQYDVDYDYSAYNNCPQNTDNRLGVGSNSCCFLRPERIDQYPDSNAGLIGAPICRNTYISVTFNREIPSQYLQNNISLVQSYPRNYSCADHRGEDVTSVMNRLFTNTGTGGAIAREDGFWGTVWGSVKKFFAKIVSVIVYAEDPEPNIVPTNLDTLRWCTAEIPLDIQSSYTKDLSGTVTETLVSIYPKQALAANSYVAVLLRGGKDGIKDSFGISLKSPFTDHPELSDYWLFKTSDQVCKLKSVTIEPTEALYTTPNTPKDFVAQAHSIVGDQLIVSLAGEYEWVWNWHPTTDQIFSVPNVLTPENTISSKAVQGHTDAVVQVDIVEDRYPPNSQKGNTYSATASLDAFFCQKPWPASGVTLSEDIASVNTVFKDLKYNFSMKYCADSGNPLTSADDLPYFSQIQVIVDPDELGIISNADPNVLRRYLMFADKNSDAIGIQIFANPKKSDGTRRTLEEWYTNKFGDMSGVAKKSVAGYDALTNENNVYINAFNIDTDIIYNNVYLFSIDINATPETRQVFTKLIDSLSFNINISNYGKCLVTDSRGVRQTPDVYTEISCTTDFDCRDSSGFPAPGTSGVCSNAKTKFFRDITRLEQIHAAQIKTDAYFSTYFNTPNFQLNLSGGTYIPAYTNSKWPSWGKLGSLIGGAPVDPVNQWAGCSGHDPSTCWNAASTTYKCPIFAQSYEYAFSSTTKSYTYYVPFEFLHSSDDRFISQYLNLSHVSYDRWCQPESIQTSFAGQCGDGTINIGEECDPPGESVLSSVGSNGQACTLGTYAIKKCSTSCKYAYENNGVCSPQGPQTCGNGIVERPIETCDAGTQNGQYGSQCTTDCKLATAENGQYCGNEKIDQVNGRYVEFCETVHRTSEYTCEHIANNQLASIVPGACSLYSLNKAKTCAWNCQGYGEYCGDSVVQTQHGEQCDQGATNGQGACTAQCKFVQSTCGDNKKEGAEQCDDGNKTNGDGCSAECASEALAVAAGPQCGNGVVDTGEQCDLKDANGKVCILGYGASCTYCSNACKNVVVDATAYCGNGIVDFITPQTLEACDYDSEGVYTAFIGTNKAPLVCSDKGSFACSNSCTQIQNNCVSCGIGDTLPKPKLLVLNPMLQLGKFPLSYDLNIGLYRRNQNTFEKFGERPITGAQYINPFSAFNLFIDSNFNVLPTGLQTNLVCNGEYVMLFNKEKISDTATGYDGRVNEQELVVDDLADAFNYEVKGEGVQVTNELVVSPAVPDNQIRIVTRWKKKTGSSIKFVGEMYQDRQSQSVGTSGNTFSYFDNVSGGSVPGNDLNCGEVEKNADGYYIPHQTNCFPKASSIWMHKILSPDSASAAVQGITIFANDLPSNKTIGFYVASPNGPINQYKDYELWVDVYMSHSAQIPEFSVFQPTYSFSINDAVPSTYSLARYWHVFNIQVNEPHGGTPLRGEVTGRTFTVLPIGTENTGTIQPGYGGAIVTDQCQVRSKMYSTTPC